MPLQDEPEHQERLGRINQLACIGEMTSSLAHELNQPLTAINTLISGCLHLSGEGAKKQARLQEALEAVQEQVERARDTIKSMQQFVHHDRTVLALVDPELLVRELMPLIEAEAKTRGVRIDLDLATSLPWIRADAMQIKQVLLNLARNAFTAMERISGPEKRLVISAHGSGENEVEVSVTNSGPAVPEEQMEKMFDYYYSTTKNGLGIGLSLCRSIIDAHQGRLWAAPGLQDGACFKFTLPIEQERDGR